VSPNNLLA